MCELLGHFNPLRHQKCRIFFRPMASPGLKVPRTTQFGISARNTLKLVKTLDTSFPVRATFCISIKSDYCHDFENDRSLTANKCGIVEVVLCGCSESSRLELRLTFSTTGWNSLREA